MINKDAGVVLKATEALQTQRTFSRQQVAFLLYLSYRTGYAHGVHDGLHDHEPLDPVLGTPEEARAKRKAQRLAEYTKMSGDAIYKGGPVQW